MNFRYVKYLLTVLLIDHRLALTTAYWVDVHFTFLKIFVLITFFIFVGGPQPPQQPGQQQPYNYPSYGGYGGQPGGPDNQWKAICRRAEQRRGE